MEMLSHKAVRYAKIIREAYEIENDYAPSLPELCDRLGIILHYELMDPQIDGMYFRLQKPHIVINDCSSKTLQRKRFSIAHEIFHYLATSGRPVSPMFSGPNQRSPIEIACNRFAADILMPEISLRSFFHELRTYDPGKIIATLSGIYAVSRPAMQKRLIELSLIEPF